MGFVSIRIWTFNAVLSLLIKQSVSEMDLSPYASQMIGSPVKVDIAILQLETGTSTTTTPTTTQRVIPVAIPVVMPSAVQIAVSALQPPQFCDGKQCPFCPPCLCAPFCTPSFFSFCSRCHQKCRCRRSEDAPKPLPLVPPQPLPRPVFALPAPVTPPPHVMMPYETYPWSKVGLELNY